MLCNNHSNSNTSWHKHYKPIERKKFLEILDPFKHVIKRNGNTVKDREVAWEKICSTYNKSAVISQKRTVQQLKKLWKNIKHNQRREIKKGRQSPMATCGDPEANINPHVAVSAPRVMKTASVVSFISDMTEQEIGDTFNIQQDNVELYPSGSSNSRTTHMIEGKEHLANITLKYKERRAALKEKYRKKINYLHLKYLEEIKIRKAELKRLEYELQQEENIGPEED